MSVLVFVTEVLRVGSLSEYLPLEFEFELAPPPLELLPIPLFPYPELLALVSPPYPPELLLE